MGATRKSRVPKSEQFKLIMECRNSGMTDADWCRENGIAPSTFYNWVSRCRKEACGTLPEPNYGHSEVPLPKQDVVPIDIVPDHFPEPSAVAASQQETLYIDNSHTIEVEWNHVKIRICNDVNPAVLSETLHLLKEFSC